MLEDLEVWPLLVLELSLLAMVLVVVVVGGDGRWCRRDDGSSHLAVPVIVKTGAGQKRAQISLSYLLNKDLRKVEPNENEGNTHLPVVGW